MESTTLVTFWFKAPPEVHTVELFGSWDNFSAGYRMQKNSHKGPGQWTGCHRFENIVCDGIRPKWSKPRNGALKQGGRYWYYYKLNDEEECFDPCEPSTATCPLLPGQMVNVLEVPVEVVPPPQRISSAGPTSMSTGLPEMTCDPADRYKKVHRKAPTKLPRLYCSSDAVHEIFNEQTSTIMSRGGAVQPPSPNKQQRLDSAGNKSLKRVRSPRAPYQQPGSCFIRSTSDEMEAMVQSFSDNLPELTKLPELRPFGPMPDYESDARPTTRHGTRDGGPLGLGISFPACSFEAFSAFAAQEFYDQPPSPPLSPSSDRLSRPVTPSWPSKHPSPLQSNSAGTAEVMSPTTPSDAAFPYSSTATSFFGSSPEDFHPGFGHDRAVGGTGIHDMVSPTFTAETMSSEEEQRTPVDDFRLSDYLGNSTSKTDYSDGMYSNAHHSNPTNTPPRTSAQAVEAKASGLGLAVNNASSATLKPQPSQSRDGRTYSLDSDTTFYSFPDWVSSRPVTREEEEIVGAGFASTVFGALGL